METKEEYLVPVTIEEGTIFHSYQDLKATVVKWSIENNVTIGIRDSSKCKPNKPYAAALEKSYVVWECIHGSARKSRGKGERPLRKTVKIQCPFRLRAAVGFVNGQNCLKITHFINSHNHEVSRETIVPNSHHDPENMRLALNMVKANILSVKEAASEYKVSKSKLGEVVKGKPFSTVKAPEVLTKEQEDGLCEWLVSSARSGNAKTLEEIGVLIQETLNEEQRPTVFRDNKPGRTWIRSFLRRYPQLKVQKSKVIEILLDDQSGQLLKHDHNKGVVMQYHQNETIDRRSAKKKGLHSERMGTDPLSISVADRLQGACDVEVDTPEIVIEGVTLESNHQIVMNPDQDEEPDDEHGGDHQLSTDETSNNDHPIPIINQESCNSNHKHTVQREPQACLDTAVCLDALIDLVISAGWSSSDIYHIRRRQWANIPPEENEHDYKLYLDLYNRIVPPKTLISISKTPISNKRPVIKPGTKRQRTETNGEAIQPGSNQYVRV